MNPAVHTYMHMHVCTCTSVHVVVHSWWKVLCPQSSRQCVMTNLLKSCHDVTGSMRHSVTVRSPASAGVGLSSTELFHFLGTMPWSLVVYWQVPAKPNYPVSTSRSYLVCTNRSSVSWWMVRVVSNTCTQLTCAVGRKVKLRQNVEQKKWKTYSLILWVSKTYKPGYTHKGIKRGGCYDVEPHAHTHLQAMHFQSPCAIRWPVAGRD